MSTRGHNISTGIKRSYAAKRANCNFFYWWQSGYTKKKKCERCVRKLQLIVHHKDRNQRNNDFPYSNLETLCRACHAIEHTLEIAKRQRDPEVNRRRGASISKSKKLAKLAGKKYLAISEAAIRTWNGEGGVKLRKSRISNKYRMAQAVRMRKLMNDPQHIAKRKQMREARLANS